MEGALVFYAACFLLPLFNQIIISKATSEKEWSYSGDTGPRYWKRLFPDCEGKYQSPINIAKTREKKNMLPLTLKHYDKLLDEPVVENDGHGLKLSVRDSQATISGGCLDGEYLFNHLHFHWGSDNEQGSEHTLNDKRFAMEMHLVHINKKYDNIQEALLQGDGLAVLGVFFQVRSFNNSLLDPIVKGVRKIKYIGQKVEVEENSLTLESLLPLEQNRFYCYRNGSLTTPECSTAVTFTLFSSSVHIGEKQIAVFRTLRFGNSSTSPFMTDNFRPIQDTNKRKIYFYNSARTLSPFLLIIISHLLFALYVLP